MSAFPLLACGPSFGPTTLIFLGAIVIAIYTTPVIALANLIMICVSHLKHRAIHAAIFGGCAFLTVLAFAPYDSVPEWCRLACGAAVANIVAAQFGVLSIKAWRLRRRKNQQ